MKRAIVVGSGAGGAAAAMALQEAYDVTVLEAGNEFRRLTMKNSTLDRWRRLGLRLDVGWIPRLFPAMRIAKTGDMVVVYGKGLGGTTTLSTGNALRLDADLKAMAIDLDPEFEEIGREIPISTAHRERWGDDDAAPVRRLRESGARAPGLAQARRLFPLPALRPVHPGVSLRREVGQPGVPQRRSKKGRAARHRGDGRAGRAR